MTLNLNGRITLVGCLWLLGSLPLCVFENLLPVEWGRCGVVYAVCCRRRVVVAMWHKVIAAGIGLAACVEGVECRVDMNGWRRNGGRRRIELVVERWYVGTPLGVEIDGWHGAIFAQRLADSCQQNLEYGAVVLKLYFSLCRVNVDIDACGVNMIRNR